MGLIVFIDTDSEAEYRHHFVQNNSKSSETQESTFSKEN